MAVVDLLETTFSRDLAPGDMRSFNLLNWLYANFAATGTSATLLNSLSAPVQSYETTILRGANLSISPNTSALPPPEGPALSTRTASGTVTKLIYGRGFNSDFAIYPYEITGLSISFSDLIANGGDVLAFVLSGNDQINGTEYVESMQGYDGNDRLTPGFANSTFGGTDIVDGGAGQDVIWFADMNVGVTVNLAANTASGTDLVTGYVIRAALTSIENATGGSGGDTLIGDSGANVLSGGQGNDALYGGGGDDVLLPGLSVATAEGVDKVDGGAGSDTVSFADIVLRSVTIDLASGRAFDFERGSNFIGVSVNLISIENAIGSQLSDAIIGSAAANVLSGGSGGDRLYGGAGNDALYGDAGNDVLRGDSGADIVNGGSGIDRADYTTSSIGVSVNLAAGTASDGDRLAGIENLYGSAHNDVLTGSAGNNVLYASSGNDQLYGLAGNDTLEGMFGDDTAFGGDGNDRVSGAAGNDGLFGEAGADTIFGGDGNDFVSGGDGDDVIFGDAGNDQMLGGAGDDFIVLGLGDDALTLGAGRDLVRFDYGNGKDTIFDFKSGEDRLDFTHTDLTLAAIQANVADTAAGVLMALGSGTILLSGVHLADINWGADLLIA